MLRNDVKSLTCKIEQLENENKELFKKYKLLSEEIIVMKNDLWNKKEAAHVLGSAAGGGRGKKFYCGQCDFSTNIKSSLKKHTTTKHKPHLVPILEPTACRRSFDGCLNIVEQYSDPLAALCPTCKLTIKRSLEQFPPPFNVCVCCQADVCLPQACFCPNCNRLLMEDNHVDSGYGVWVRDCVSSDIVCIEYSRPDPGLL